jgi:hypothetical protein
LVSCVSKSSGWDNGTSASITLRAAGPADGRLRHAAARDGAIDIAGTGRLVRVATDGALDTAFGGRQQPALAQVRIPRQRARADADLRRILARVTASGPGLVSLRVRDGRRRVLAAVVAPVYAADTTNVRIPLTATGRRVLRRTRTLRVRVGHRFRDVLTRARPRHDDRTAAVGGRRRLTSRRGRSGG